MNFAKHCGTQRMWRQPHRLTITYQYIRAHRYFDLWKKNVPEGPPVTSITPPCLAEAETSQA